MDKALQFPGVSNAWTMPIRNRIDMLVDWHPDACRRQDDGARPRCDGWRCASGREVLKTVRGASSAYAERVMGGYYLDIVPTASARAIRPDDGRRPGDHRDGARRRDPSPRRSKVANDIRSRSAIRAICALTRRRSPATC
ncbi:hypothetical protein [Methylocystis parvus]|uniref:hypothetical protein n=1 Tax=Methylocystis parvus TaxID=134 RepID=UPI003C72D60C